MWLGKWKDRTDEPFGFKWLKEPINALGVFNSYNQASVTVTELISVKKKNLTSRKL